MLSQIAIDLPMVVQVPWDGNPAQKTSFLPRLKKMYVIQFKLSEVIKQMKKKKLSGTQGAAFEVDYRAYEGFHCKKEILLKVVLRKEN